MKPVRLLFRAAQAGACVARYAFERRDSLYYATALLLSFTDVRGDLAPATFFLTAGAVRDVGRAARWSGHARFLPVDRNCVPITRPRWRYHLLHYPATVNASENAAVAFKAVSLWVAGIGASLVMAPPKANIPDGKDLAALAVIMAVGFLYSGVSPERWAKVPKIYGQMWDWRRQQRNKDADGSGSARLVGAGAKSAEEIMCPSARPEHKALYVQNSFPSLRPAGANLK